jgi:thymidylate synthase
LGLSLTMAITGMNDHACGSVGKTWLQLVRRTVQDGSSVNDECIELLNAQVAFPAGDQADELIRQFGNSRMIAEMETVFFTDKANTLGHSYAKLMRGPDGRNDFQDVISLLRTEPASKRAVVTLCGPGGGKVPCVNIIQFLVRSGTLLTIYFARGQDAFKKFYADAHCIAMMARRVAEGLGVEAGAVSGVIGSSHVYHNDRAAIEDFLARGSQFLENGEAKGAF